MFAQVQTVLWVIQHNINYGPNREWESMFIKILYGLISTCTLYTMDLFVNGHTMYDNLESAFGLTSLDLQGEFVKILQVYVKYTIKYAARITFMCPYDVHSILAF